MTKDTEMKVVMWFLGIQTAALVSFASAAIGIAFNFHGRITAIEAGRGQVQVVYVNQSQLDALTERILQERLND